MVTRIVIAAAVVLLGALIWLAVDGARAVAELLITVFVLVLLVGGGNWLGGRRTPAPPPGSHEREPSGDSGAPTP